MRNLLFAMSVIRAAGYVIFRKTSCNNIEYLLLQASYPDYHWSAPKGHVDPGECEAETALREVEEETGIIKDNLKIIDGFEKTLNYVVNSKPKEVIYWLAELRDPNSQIILSSEHKDFKWLPLEEACIVAKFKESKDLLNSCHNYLLNHK